MAYIVSYICMKCHKQKSTAVGAGSATPTQCEECTSKENDIKRRLHFSGLDGLTVEERLRKIEEWIYDYRAPINIHDVRF